MSEKKRIGPRLSAESRDALESLAAKEKRSLAVMAEILIDEALIARGH